MTALPPASLSRLVSANGAELPLRAAHLSATAHAGFARVTLEQVFFNPHNTPLEVSYQLPLPADAAVGGFSFVLGDERVVGEIQRKSDARETYTRALAEGRTAALLEQVRDSLFSQAVGNVPPGATVRVTVELDQPLLWRDGAWEWRFPTVVAPRYVDDLVTDAPALAVDVADAPLGERLTLRLQIDDVVTAAVTSPSHAISQDEATLTLSGGRARLDRDVVVRWPVAGPVPGATVSTGTFGGERFALITLVPPVTPRAVVARDLILLLDVSGSMSGEPMAQLQRVSHELIGGLSASDTLEVVAFGGTVRRWRTAPEAMHDAARTDAQRWVAGLVASGGTPMDDGIREALAGKREGAQRQVVLMTDGEIGFEGRVVGLIRAHLGKSSRLHVVGVGHGVNRALTTPAARVGAGLEEILTPGEPGTAAIGRLKARMERPVVVDVRVEGSVLGLVPEQAPDLFAGAPVRLLARVRPGSLQIVGRNGDGAWQHALQIPENEVERPDLARLFAREAVADLEVRRACQEAGTEARIEELGLRYRITTRMTSFVAVSCKATVEPGTGRLAVTQPHEQTAGMSLQGLGLITPMAGGGGMARPMAASFAAPGGPMPAAPPSPMPQAEMTRSAPKLSRKRSKEAAEIEAPMEALEESTSVLRSVQRDEAPAEPPADARASRPPTVRPATWRPPAAPAPAPAAQPRKGVLATLGGAVRRLLGRALSVAATAVRWEGDCLVVTLRGVDWQAVGSALGAPVALSRLPGGEVELRVILPDLPALTSITLDSVVSADGSVDTWEVTLPAPTGA